MTWTRSATSCCEALAGHRRGGAWLRESDLGGQATSTRACSPSRASDLEPPPHWRLEAVAATPRPRSLTVGADGAQAVFIEDGDTSDVWLLDLDAGAAPSA